MAWKKRSIGHSGIDIAPLMLGTNTFGWTADATATFEILDSFVGAGFNAIDTADMYSYWVPGHVGGESECLIGEWLKSRGGRDRIVIATKGGARRSEWGSRGWQPDLSARYLVAAVEASLRRLQTDYIDLFQMHCFDPATPIAETLDALDRLRRSGKIRALGVSNHAAEQLRETVAARGVSEAAAGFQALQVKYNLSDREEFEAESQRVCHGADLGVLCYSALAKGFLTGAYRSRDDIAASEWHNSLASYQGERGDRILASLDRIAAHREAPMGAVALAWLIAQPTVTAAIVGINNVHQLASLSRAASLTLEPFETDALNSASAYGLSEDGRAAH